jgi:type I restriction enzyme M protein
MARRVFPSRLELNSVWGSGREAPRKKVSFTTCLYDSPVQTPPSCDQTGVPGDEAFAHFHATSGAADSPIRVDDALKADPGERFEMVLTNPPFGRKSSMTVVNAEGENESEQLTIVRDDFWASTSNKQLNFVQHVKTLLAINGRAAVVVPDNVLFEGGAGETVRRKLLQECDVHTLLRLPTGVIYAQGVKANVLFFERKPAAEAPWTRDLWVYDLRTNMHFTLKQNPLRLEHLQDFIESYQSEERGKRLESERFKRFGYDELMQRDKVSLDLIWLRDDSLENMDNLPPPDVIAQEIVEDLEAALSEFAAIAESLRSTTPEAG